MKDKVVMVTGATNGIGEVTATELARMGARVVIVSRSPAKCDATVARIQSETGNSQVEAIPANLSSMQEVRELAQVFQAKYDRLDVLVNNAGAVFSSREASADGYEMTLALNHLSYFLLTNLLLDQLQASARDTGDVRVVNVSSAAHNVGSVNFDDLQREKGYSGLRVYGESKLMNILFSNELARRLQGTGITSNALHPGMVRTGFGMNNGAITRAFISLFQFFAISAARGAETPIHLASSPAVADVTGAYFENSKAKKPHRFARDVEAAQKLWAISEQLVNLETAPMQ